MSRRARMPPRRCILLLLSLLDAEPRRQRRISKGGGRGRGGTERSSWSEKYTSCRGDSPGESGPKLESGERFDGMEPAVLKLGDNDGVVVTGTGFMRRVSSVSLAKAAALTLALALANPASALREADRDDGHWRPACLDRLHSCIPRIRGRGVVPVTVPGMLASCTAKGVAKCRVCRGGVGGIARLRRSGEAPLAHSDGQQKPKPKWLGALYDSADLPDLTDLEGDDGVNGAIWLLEAQDVQGRRRRFIWAVNIALLASWGS